VAAILPSSLNWLQQTSWLQSPKPDQTWFEDFPLLTFHDLRHTRKLQDYTGGYPNTDNKNSSSNTPTINGKASNNPIFEEADENKDGPRTQKPRTAIPSSESELLHALPRGFPHTKFSLQTLHVIPNLRWSELYEQALLQFAQERFDALPLEEKLFSFQESSEDIVRCVKNVLNACRQKQRSHPNTPEILQMHMFVGDHCLCTLKHSVLWNRVPFRCRSICI
jgi:hypothetical protein